MTKLEITLGLENDRTGAKLSGKTSKLALAQIRQRLVDTYGGASQYFGQGIWKSPDGLVVGEKIVTFVCYVPDSQGNFPYPQATCQELGKILNQHSVALAITKPNGSFDAEFIEVDYES
jgi:hypothetical protein